MSAYDAAPEPSSNGAPVEAQKSYQLIRFSDVIPERISWIWPGHIPAGKLTLIDGDPGEGKSTLSDDFAARVSTGSPMPDGSPGVKGTVLALSAEDGIADTIVHRLAAHDADLSRVITLTEVCDRDEEGRTLPARPVELPGDLPVIERIIRAQGVVLVIIDPLMAFLDSSVNSYRDQDVRRALHPMANLAEETRAAFIVIRHLNKSSGVKAIYRGGGSIGIGGAARSVFLVAPDPDDETEQRHLLASVKINIAVKPPTMAYRIVPDIEHGCSRIAWDGTSTHTAESVIRASGADDETPSERQAAAQWLAGYLIDRGGEAPRSDIMKAGRGAGYTEATLKRARVFAGVKHEAGGFPRTTVWTYPTVSSSPAESGEGELTEPTGSDLRKQDSWVPETSQSAHTSTGEPTEPLDPVLAGLGETTHPTCDGWPEGSIGQEAAP